MPITTTTTASPPPCVDISEPWWCAKSVLNSLAPSVRLAILRMSRRSTRADGAILIVHRRALPY